MTREQYQKLKSLENRPTPVFTNSLEGKNPGSLSLADIQILNEVAKDTIKEKYSNCPACITARRRFLKNMAKEFFVHQSLYDV